MGIGRLQTVPAGKAAAVAMTPRGGVVVIEFCGQPTAWHIVGPLSRSTSLEDHAELRRLVRVAADKLRCGRVALKRWRA